MLLVAATDPIVAETHALVTETRGLAAETHGIVIATFSLAVVTALAIIIPLLARALSRRKSREEETERARETIETIAKLLEARLGAVAAKNVNQARIVGGSRLLIERLLDPRITAYLPRGTFDLLHHAAYHVYGVLDKAQVEMPAAQAVIDYPLSDTGSVKTARATIESLSQMAVVGVAMLTGLRRRIATNDPKPFIDWETERAQN